MGLSVGGPIAAVGWAVTGNGRRNGAPRFGNPSIGLRFLWTPFMKNAPRKFLKDPWAARNDYIDVILDRGDENLKRFFEKHGLIPLSEVDKVDALRLLEMQRQRLLMFTSCAWFFDEVSGLESTTVLTSAARALQIAGAFPEGASLEKVFLAGLAEAKSNIPEIGNGAVVYERYVKPVAADLPRIAAHQALKALWREEQDRGSVYCFDYTFLDRRTERASGSALSIGRIRVQSQITRESLDAAYAVIHLGGHDFHCVLRASPEIDRLRPVLDRLLDVFNTGSMTEALGLLSQHFDPRVFDLQDLLLEERRHILSAVIEDILGRFEGTYRMLVDENKKLMNYLLKGRIPHAPRISAWRWNPCSAEIFIKASWNSAATMKSNCGVKAGPCRFKNLQCWSELGRRWPNGSETVGVPHDASCQVPFLGHRTTVFGPPGLGGRIGAPSLSLVNGEHLLRYLERHPALPCASDARHPWSSRLPSPRRTPPSRWVGGIFRFLTGGRLLTLSIIEGDLRWLGPLRF
jgi:hypothetical protein